MNTLGLMPVRVRSESPAFAARFAYVAGANSYNTWINERVSAAIQALAGATLSDDGSMIVMLPAGFGFAEGQKPAANAPTQPTAVKVSAEQSAKWMSPAFSTMYEQLGTPFVPSAAKLSSITVDCDIAPCVALTYDDGPSDLTPALLDVLDAKAAPVTFFTIGWYMSQRPEVVKRAFDAGHEIGSHTVSHKDLTAMSVAQATAEINDAAAQITGITGSTVTIFRPPFGYITDEVIASVGMPSVHWSVDPQDWRKPGQQALIDATVPVANAGSIILMHDVWNDTIAVAPGVIDGLRDRGFVLVTVTQLFGGQVPVGVVRAR